MVFKDMLRFLWIIAGEQKTPHPHFKIGIYDSMTIIDEMWHTFFLFSQEYQEFCFKYFGKILFHSGHPNPLTYAPDAIPNRERMIEFIWKEFGSGTARRWFDTYQKKYSKLKIKKMQLSAALKQ